MSVMAQDPTPESGSGQAVPEWTPVEAPEEQPKSAMARQQVSSSDATGVWFLRPTPLPIYEAKDYTPSSFYRFYGKSELAAAYDTALSDNERMLFEVVAKSNNSRATGSALFEKYAAESQRLSQDGIRKSPQDILYEVARKRGILGDDGTFSIPENLMPKPSGRGSARGVYTGPTETRTMASERDLRLTADTLASDILGRAVTDEEFQSVLEKVRKAEQAEPTITESRTGGTTTMQGLSATGRQDVIRDALAQGEEAEEFAKATDMMGFFYEWLEGRPG